MLCFLGFIVVFGCSGYGTQVYEFGTHGLSCRFSKGHHLYIITYDMHHSMTLSSAPLPRVLYLDDVILGGNLEKGTFITIFVSSFNLGMLCTANA